MNFVGFVKYHMVPHTESYIIVNQFINFEVALNNTVHVEQYTQYTYIIYIPIYD